MEDYEVRRVKGARVWGWGDDLELAGKNAQTYVNKRWGNKTEECSIAVDGRSEDILFKITAYMSKPEVVEDLVNNLFDIALTRGSKIYSVTVSLYDHMASSGMTCTNSLPFVREAYERRKQILMEKFKEHPEVKSLLEEGRTLIVIPATAILCELESKCFNKVIVWTSNYDLDPLMDYVHFIANRLIERKIATRIVGYDLRNNVEELTILDIDLDMRGKKVYLWLDHPPVK
ncbi:MAG: hypothetical protein FGF51_06895 [Candidatus Brockarchaeota archaeon]|nr:hypothetical protein [Candidatus Brockarchaeota archaeon]